MPKRFSQFVLKDIGKTKNEPELSEDRTPLPRERWGIIRNGSKQVRYPRPDLVGELFQPDMLRDCTLLERYIAYLYFTCGEGVVTIGKRLGMRRERVRLVKNRIIKSEKPDRS